MNEMIDNAIKQIENYRTNNVNLPFFVACDNPSAEYKELKKRLAFQTSLRLSDFCRENDTRPVLDDFFDRLNKSTCPVLVYGLGEYLGFLGEPETKMVLGRLKDLPQKMVIVLCGLHSFIERYKSDDMRFDNRRVYIFPQQHSPTFTMYPLDYPEESYIKGFKTFLQQLEDGEQINKYRTALCWSNPIVSVKRIPNSYASIKHFDKNFALPFEYGNAEQWDELLQRFKDNGCRSLTELLAKQKINIAYEEQFRKSVNSDSPFAQWLYFIAVKHSPQTIQNDYLRRVAEVSQFAEEFIENIVNYLLQIPSNAQNFWNLYQFRRDLLQNNNFYETKVADYVLSAKEKGLHYLTNNTLAERQAIVEIVSQTQALQADILPKIYPVLSAYLQRTKIVNEEITEYFQQYKEQKLFNDLRQDFLEQVQNIAVSRPYNSLPSRNELVQRITPAKKCLYFVDALGAEFIALIRDFANKHGLSASIEVGRADLPTITSNNKRFYEEWDGDKKETRELDDIKHGNGKTRTPAYFAEEFDIIEKILNEIEHNLRNKKYEQVVLVSDHGASRLAVLHKQELQVASKGEHSGRCCPAGELSDIKEIPNATTDNGYWVLADYSRFRGSRAASVEVHGGATLEEVLVPVITLTLAKNEPVKIQLVSDNLTYRPKQPLVLTLILNTPFDKVAIRLSEKEYDAEKIEDHKFYIALSNIKTGKYTAEVFGDGNSIGNITFAVQSPAATENDLGL